MDAAFVSFQYDAARLQSITRSMTGYSVQVVAYCDTPSGGP
jgi:hypothetical protein